jgi:phosphoribosylformimino-5-aminoimidazole carboxamide ribonucleotide (ProFAR) isomerase
MVAKEFETFKTIAETFPGRVVPAVEVAGETMELRVAGWTATAPMSLGELCQKLRGLPCPAVLVTDVERDGTLEGPNITLTRRVGLTCQLPGIVSGGVRSLDDLKAARAPEVGAVIVGKALYDGIFSVEEAMAAMGTR